MASPLGVDAAPPSALEHQLLRELAIERFGLDLPLQRRQAMAPRLRRRLEARGVGSFGEYYQLLRRAPGEEEWGLFADAVTNAETYFFRARGQFDELIGLLDQLGDRRVRVLSAGCASGEEAYSLAAVLAAHADRLPHGFEVVGTDISTPRLAEACVARYRMRSFREEPSVPGGGALEEHFERERDVWSPRASLRAHVTFQIGNLADPGGLHLGQFDVIFCRNVLIYAHAGGLPRFLQTLAGALAPGGYLFLGDSEPLLGHRTFAARRLRHHFAYVHVACPSAW